MCTDTLSASTGGDKFVGINSSAIFLGNDADSGNAGTDVNSGFVDSYTALRELKTVNEEAASSLQNLNSGGLVLDLDRWDGFDNAEEMMDELNGNLLATPGNSRRYNHQKMCDDIMKNLGQSSPFPIFPSFFGSSSSPDGPSFGNQISQEGPSFGNPGPAGPSGDSGAKPDGANLITALDRTSSVRSVVSDSQNRHHLAGLALLSVQPSTPRNGGARDNLSRDYAQTTGSTLCSSPDFGQNLSENALQFPLPYSSEALFPQTPIGSTNLNLNAMCFLPGSQAQNGTPIPNNTSTPGIIPGVVVLSTGDSNTEKTEQHQHARTKQHQHAHTKQRRYSSIEQHARDLRRNSGAHFAGAPRHGESTHVLPRSGQRNDQWH